MPRVNARDGLQALKTLYVATTTVLKAGAELEEGKSLLEVAHEATGRLKKKLGGKKKRKKKVLKEADEKSNSAEGGVIDVEGYPSP